MDMVTCPTPSSYFLILAPQDIFMAPALEWFPALTEQMSIITIQGTEWLMDPERNFTARYEQYLALEPCLDKAPDCLASWAETYGLSFDYVYLSLAFGEPSRLYGEMSQSPDYSLVYDTPTFKIFARAHE